MLNEERIPISQLLSKLDPWNDRVNNDEWISIDNRFIISTDSRCNLDFCSCRRISEDCYELDFGQSLDITNDQFVQLSKITKRAIRVFTHDLNIIHFHPGKILDLRTEEFEISIPENLNISECADGIDTILMLLSEETYYNNDYA